MRAAHAKLTVGQFEARIGEARAYQGSVTQSTKLVKAEAAKPGGHNIIRDCYSDNPVRSPVDGSMIDSRAKLRDHNRRHGVVDVGNDPGCISAERQGQVYRPDREAIREDAKMAMARHGWSE